MMTRALLLVQQTFKSKQTQKLYEHHIEKFRKFTGIKNLDSLAKLPISQLQMMMENYLIHLKKTQSANTIPVAMAPIKKFFVMNRVRGIDFEVIQKMYPAQTKKSGYNSYNREQIKDMLRSTTKKRSRALILFLESTGSRIGVVEELKVSHLEEISDGCYCVTFYEGDKEEYVGFLTPEAKKALDEYHEERRRNGEHLDSESPLFRNEHGSGMLKVHPLTKTSAQMILYKCIKRAGIERKKVGKRYDIQIAHGIRKFFNTTIKSVPLNYSMAEKLMGHKSGLDGVYFTASKEELFEEFKKAIPALTIDNSERQELKIQKLETENSDLRKPLPDLFNEAVQRAIVKLQEMGCIVQSKNVKIN